MTRAAVLIIDDDDVFRELVRMCVDDLGVDVLEAADCVRGAALLRQERDRVGLVLLDYWMPHMAPMTCSLGIRELAHSSTRIVLVTAAVDAKARADEVGLSEWLAKPVDIKLLRAMVQTLSGFAIASVR